MYIFFDTETNARTENGNFTYRQHVMQLAYYILDSEFNVIKKRCWFIKDVAKKVYEHQKILTIDSIKDGKTWSKVFQIFMKDLKKYIVSTNGRVVAHNIKFDKKVIMYSCLSKNIDSSDFQKIIDKHGYCTQEPSSYYCKLPKTGYYAGTKGYKWPKLEELHGKMFKKDVEQTHLANDDVEMLIRCYVKGDRIGVFPKRKGMKKVILKR